jgi:hypothetical protein
MNSTPYGKLLAFLERLDKARIPYKLSHSRTNAIMVTAYAPGQYWEIEFVADGDIDVQRYHSNGHIDDESVLEELFRAWSEPEPATTGAAVKQDATTA